jgi:hypothetical protein
MNTELDYNLTQDQWETLKALRRGAPERRSLSRFVLDQLVVLGLACLDGEVPAITAVGRKVLIRGSSKLWEDVAA